MLLMLLSVLGHSEAALGTNDPINKRREIQDSLTSDLSVFFTRSHKQFVSHCPVSCYILRNMFILPGGSRPRHFLRRIR